ncbi:MAG: bifunctional [glutamate--ammonia ligase]-adenylyl-L-tyrosine phosphorylase/[glutamate--ammonia-ligase] adenylyltransferase [Mariprofundaceae bacterium]|nr:bifunctional [glutamate--ammonia ligase]-adenylyl-L-tyrosine phosphorylase/[glutamate--ammonia-ligase] adenylyltransferase [Mariprofundaceae bacterium]
MSRHARAEPPHQTNTRLTTCLPLFKRLMHRLPKTAQDSVIQAPKTAVLPTFDWLPKQQDELDVDSCQRHLRYYKQWGLCHFIWWELGLHGDPVTSWQSISALADSLIAEALRMAKLLIAPRFGHIADASFCIIALGKLGGCELNMGSDVDLLFVWRANGNSQGGRKSLPAAEYYAQLSRMFIRLMDEHTSDGQVWPVDMRLRPGGASAAIALSLDASLGHYLDYGQTWERAMLIKARSVAGDMALGASFLEGLLPFKFRRYLDFTTVTALAEMKRRIDQEQHITMPDVGFDVKKGYGGIREIEFTVQALQLLHGARNDLLRHQRNTLNTLEILKEQSIVPAEEANTLRLGYIFWRRIEHAIQAQHGEQTQRMPADYATWMPNLLAIDGFNAQMHKHAEQIHTIFAERLLPSSPLNTDNGIQCLQGKACLQNQTEENKTAMQQSLQRIRQHLRRGLLPERSGAQVARILQYVMPLWVKDDHGVQALDAFADLIHAIGGRATWIDLLDTHRGTLTWLVGVLSASRYVAAHIVRDPSWLEWPLYHERGAVEVSRLCADLNSLDVSTMADEQFLAALGHGVDHVRLHSALAIDAHEQDALQIGIWLSDIADAATAACIRYSLERLGLPHDFPFVALAMGKHGSQEMGLVSDLDMVFVLVADHDRAMLGERNLRDWAQRLGRRVIQSLTSQPPFGAGYEFDARLRPSGQSGVLVIGMKAFEDYQRHRADTWEHQALCRARTVAGPKQAQQYLTDCVQGILVQPRVQGDLVKDILAMRQKILTHLGSHEANTINLKHDQGGMVDIEFLAQWSRLAFGGTSQGTIATLRHPPPTAPAAWLIDAAMLAAHYLSYRELENTLRVELWQSIGHLPDEINHSEWKTLARHCVIQSPHMLQAVMVQVHQCFTRWLQADSAQASM